MIADGDVYIAGWVTQDNRSVAVYWKNGVKTLLSDGATSTLAKAITVENGDIYVAGEETVDSYRVAKYWKNGVETSLPGIDYCYYNVNGIAVDNGRVYVVGEEFSKKSFPVYWDNGVRKLLSAKSDISTANDITILNGTIYIVGQDENRAVYWTNGTKHIIGEDASGAAATCTVGKTVYVAGIQRDYSISRYVLAKYWNLNTGEGKVASNGTIDAWVTDITLALRSE